MSKKPNAECIKLLNSGTIETRNLMDAIAIDFNILLEITFPGKNLKIDNSLGITRRMASAAGVIYDHSKMNAFDVLLNHSCDTLRGIAAYMLALTPLPISDLLTAAKPLADDPHFGVREWAWLALRPAVIESLQESLDFLDPWGRDPSPLVRRFAIEITRPRGVWCAHIPKLKEHPEMATHLLTPSLSTGEKYLKESVANWLNDASKSKPDWVISLCKEWQQKSETKETQWICKRALRTITKS